MNHRTQPAKPLDLFGDLRGPVVASVALLVAGFVGLLAGAHPALLFLGSASATRALVPVVAKLALRWNAVALSGGRYSHGKKTPLLGGLAVALPFVAFLFYEGSPHSIGLALGACLIALVGTYDDIRGLSPRGKLLGQAIAALILVAAGYRVPNLSIPPLGTIPTTGFEVVLVVFWVVLVTNAFNLIDGMDGLAASAALVAALAGAILGVVPLGALVLAGAILGFLRFNLPRAQIFLGDSGSLLLGFATAGLLLAGKAAVNVPVTLCLVALPVGDVVIVATQRFLRGKPVFSGDRRHVHHRLLEEWKSPRRALVFLTLFAIANACAARLFPDLRAVAGSAILWGGVGVYLLGRARPRWTRILLDRRSFRRLHVSRAYATEALRLAERESDVTRILEWVAADFGLVSLNVGSLRIGRPSPPGAIGVEEYVDCGDSIASWSAAFEPPDAGLAEEQRTILCDVLRLARRRLLALEGDADRTAASAPPPEPSGKLRVHFVAEGRNALARIAPLVREMRQRGTLEPIVVHTGRRDDLHLTNAQLRELGLEGPDIDLDVAPADPILFSARVMERYHALLGERAPAVVVVGDSEPSLACALVAKDRGLAVAQIAPKPEDLPPGYLRRTLRESVVDLTVACEESASPADSGDRSGGDPGRDTLFHDLVPTLEALLVASPGARAGLFRPLESTLEDRSI